MKSILKATLVVTIFSLITRGVSFVYRIYLSRMIGASSLGLYQIVLSVFTVLITVTSSGIPLTVSKQTASHIAKGDRKAEFSTVTAALITGLVFSVAISVLLFCFKDFFSFLFADKRCMSIFLLLLPAVIASSMYSAFRGGLWGQKNYVAYSMTEFFEEVVMIVSGVLMLQGAISLFPNPAESAVFAITLSYFGGSLLTVLIYFMRGGRLASPRGYFKPLFKTALPITGIRIVNALMSSVVALILPIILAKSIGMEQALAQYGMILGMVFPLLFLPSTLIGSLALVLVPELSSLAVAEDRKSLSEAVNKAVNFTLVISFIIAPIYFALGPQIGAFLYKSEEAGKFLAYSAALMIPMGISQISSTMLNSLGQEMKSLRNYLIGSGLTLLCVVTLPGKVGIGALLIGDGLSGLVTSALNLGSLHRRIPLSMSFLKNLLLLLGISVPCVILAKNMYALLSTFLPPFFCLAGASVASCAMLGVLAYFFKIIDFSAFQVLLKKKPKKAPRKS